MPYSELNGNPLFSQVVVGLTSTTTMDLVQKYFVQFTVPVLSSGGSAVSTQTIQGLTTSAVYVLQPRIELNSSVTGVWVQARCSTANSLAITFNNHSISTLSGSTQSGYLLQFRTV